MAGVFCVFTWFTYPIRKMADISIYGSFNNEGHLEIGFITIFVIVALIYYFVYLPNAPLHARRVFNTRNILKRNTLKMHKTNPDRQRPAVAV